MRIKLLWLSFLALAAVSQSSLAGTITVGGYEWLSRPIEASYVKPAGVVEIFPGRNISVGSGQFEILAGGDISVGSGIDGGRGSITPLGGGDIRLIISQPIVIEGLVVDGVITAVPEPESYAMLLAGLGLVGFATRRRKQ